MQAGRCETCGVVVWVDDSGHCAVGGPLHAMVEEWTVDESDIPLGRGSLPESLQTFNWPAFLMPVLWPLVRGFGWIAGALILANVLYLLASLSGILSSAPALYAATGAHLLVFTGAGLWLGAKGNAVYWHRRDPEVATGPRTVGEYLRQQRTWLWVGLTLYGWSIFTAARSTLASQQMGGLIRGPLYYLVSVAAAAVVWRALAAKPSAALIEGDSVAKVLRVAKLVGLILILLIGVLGAAVVFGLV